MSKILTPLNKLTMALYPVLRLFKHGQARLELKMRHDHTIQKRKDAIFKAKQQKELKHEVRVFETLLRDKWDQLGLSYELRKDGSRRIIKVDFERIKYNELILWFKISTRQRGMFGVSSTLPHKVRIGDLIHEDTLRELSWTLERVVNAVYDDPKRGVWVTVYRQEGVGGLPTNVPFNSILDLWPADASKAPLVLGIGDHKKSHTVDLASHPHVLIGGATRSGKSNILNVIIAGLMRETNPNEVKFALIDLKRLEFGIYRNSPHLFKEIIKEPDKAIELLRSLKQEVERRNQILEDSQIVDDSDAKELSEWNALYPDKKMERIIVVIDEFAELVMASGSEVRQECIDLVSRITNLGRAVGIHLIIATQRPSTKVVDNSIKINMPLVIAGRVQNNDQSRVILSNGNAAALPLVPGRMIYQSGSEEYKIQTPYITVENIRDCIRIAKGKAAGVVVLEGPSPTIIPDGLTRWLIGNHDGSLSLDLVPSSKDKEHPGLSDLSITSAMFKAYREDLIKAGQVTIDGQVWKVTQHRNTYKLSAIQEDKPSTDQPALTIVRTPGQQEALDFFKKRNETRGQRNA